MSTLQKSVLSVVLVAGIAAAGWVGMLRFLNEQANATVAVTVDYNDVVCAAALTGASPQAFLTELKAAGATHVALTEVSLSELADTDKLWSATRATSIPIMSLSPEARQRVIEQTEAKLPPSVPHSYQRYGQLPDLSTQLGDLGLGYDEAVEAAKAADLRIIARPRPDFVKTPPAIDASIKAAADIVLGNFNEVGEKIKEIERLELYQNQRQGLVVRIDGFGNIITNIAKLDKDKYSVHMADKKYVMNFYPNYDSAKDDDLFLIEGSGNTLEISLKNGSADDKLHVKVGEKITIS